MMRRFMIYVGIINWKGYFEEELAEWVIPDSEYTEEKKEKLAWELYKKCPYTQKRYVRIEELEN